MVSAISPRFFGQDKPGKEPMPENCCERRKRGIPVPCCPPLPPDQLEITPSLPSAIESKVKSDASRTLANPFIRWFLGVFQWIRAFFGGIYKDLGRIVTGKD